MTIPRRPHLHDARDRAEFYRLWSAGHGAGLTHPSSLENMGERESAAVEDVRQWLLAGTRRGGDIATVVRAGGARFDDFERALLTLGDEAGRLDHALRLLADFHARKQRLMSWVRKQMVYPVFTVMVACFVAPVPLLVAGMTTAYSVIAFGAAALLLVNSRALLGAIAARYGRRPALVRARMARALSTAIEAGLPLPRAVRLAADASANAAVRDYVARIDDHRLSTAPLAEVLAGCPHLTADFVAVLATAERTGDYTPLTRLAGLYEQGFR